MKRSLVLAFLALCAVPNLASALEIKNFRPCWGPFGATRFDAKCMPGDVLFVMYEIEGLTVDKTTKKASYETILELVDSKGKVLFKNPAPNEVIPALGGGRMPGDLHVIMGPKQAPGKYKIRLTIRDKNAKADVAVAYEFEVIPESFGLVGVVAPAIGLPGDHHILRFSLVNMALDAKGKQPNAELTIRILDDNKKEVAEPAKMIMPKDMPEGTDLQKANIVQLNYPVYLNRVGRYTIEVVAQDKIGNKDAKLSYPLTVLDVSSFANK